MIREKEKFSKFWDRILKVFLSTSRLPNRVFREAYSGFSFADLDWAMSANFWESIREISDNRGERVLVAVIDPDPVEYFYKEFGGFNFVELPVEASPDDYWVFLETGPEDSPADAALYNSEVVVWIPESLEWAIWGQRDLGICVLAFKRGLGKSVSPPVGDWVPVDTALIKLLPMKFGGSKIHPVLFNGLLSNYMK